MILTWKNFIKRFYAKYWLQIGEGDNVLYDGPMEESDFEDFENKIPKGVMFLGDVQVQCNACGVSVNPSTFFGKNDVIKCPKCDKVIIGECK